MTSEEIEALFEKHDEEYLEFDRVAEKKSKRADLHAFLLLDKILPESTHDIVSGATHDEIWLDCEDEQLEACLTEELIIELVRCGVRYDSDGGGLCMFA